MRVRSAVVLSVVLFASRVEAARRWTFFELDVGGTAQALDREFRSTFGPSLLAGLRTGAFYCPPDDQRIGWEVMADFTLFDYEPLDGADVFRLRLKGGPRLERPFAPDARLIFRVLGGIDYIIASVPDRVGTTLTKEESGSLGPVLEPGVGVVWQFGEVLVGATASLPIAYHRDEDTSDRTADFDYIGIELDVLFTIGASL
jgi:hypothetical protein